MQGAGASRGPGDSTVMVMASARGMAASAVSATRPGDDVYGLVGGERVAQILDRLRRIQEPGQRVGMPR